MLAKITTLREIEEHWSLYDLLCAHEALDIQDDAEAHAMKDVDKR